MTFTVKDKFVGLGKAPTGETVVRVRPSGARHLTHALTYPPALHDFFLALAEGTVVELDIYKAEAGAPTAMGIAGARLAEVQDGA